jgi:succinate dehydrogenase hydrophobic anchor subunit
MILLLTIALVVVASVWWRPKPRPFDAAFGATAAALLFLVAGTIGFTIEKNNWSFITVTRSDAVVWWEIFYGLVALVFAVYFWRKGLRTLT